MSTYRCILEKQIPGIDEDVVGYVEGILCEGAEDFKSSDDIFDALGDILHEISPIKSEEYIKQICEQLRETISPVDNVEHKKLSAPVHIAEMLANVEQCTRGIESIWVVNREISKKVDTKRLEKAEAKLQQKLEKRQDGGKTQQNLPVQLQSATASQVINKKGNKLNNCDLNRTMVIKIENFDLAFGEKILLKGADLVLSFGRRYGLVGRNGLGKTTLLRMISERQLQIPNHITVLHVEQEVIGDDTSALDSVLQCDVERTKLLDKEKELLTLNESTSNEMINEELNYIYTQLQNIEADKAVSKASIILRGLGFTPEMQQSPTKQFSGGWRMRLALARALFSQPDLLLLDEPTNMLDIKAIIWLENYLQNWPKTLLVVSHDRNFLDVVPTDIVYMHSFCLDTYRGNYEQFNKVKTEKLKAQRREYEAQMAYRAHVQEFVDKFRYNANRASSVQSKIKMLDKLPQLKPVEKETEVKLKFPDVDSLNPPVLALNEICFQYDVNHKIFNNVNLSAGSDSRVCIVGANGAGKSTLLKLIIGKLTPTSGNISLHRGLRIGYFAQHHVDNLDMNLNSVSLLQVEHPGNSEEEYRRQLGSFGITGNLALQPIASLSGGQKSRVAFAKMCMGKPNFIVLDEPTNHLDIETITALGKAINSYKGGIILVSHDERLIRVVCKELWLCENGTVKAIEGGIDQYKKDVLMEMELLS